MSANAWRLSIQALAGGGAAAVAAAAVVALAGHGELSGQAATQAGVVAFCIPFARGVLGRKPQTGTNEQKRTPAGT